MSLWTTSNGAYGAGVVAERRRRVEEQRTLEHKYEQLAAAARRDRNVAALHSDAWQATERLAQQQVAPRLAAPVARAPKAQPPPPREVAVGAERLRQRLTALGLQEKPIIADGACQFRAVGDAMFADEDVHPDVRVRAIAELIAHAEHYKEFVQDESWESYLARLARPEVWGDALTLQALACALDVDINVVTSFPDGAVIRVEPLLAEDDRPRQQLWLGFYAEFHYVSVRPA